MSFIKSLQEALDQDAEVTRINAGGQSPVSPEMPQAPHQNFRAGDMSNQLMDLAKTIDEVHMKFREIRKGNADQYEDALNYGVPNYESQIESAIYKLEGLFQELAGEMESTNSTKFDG